VISTGSLRNSVVIRGSVQFASGSSAVLSPVGGKAQQTELRLITSCDFCLDRGRSQDVECKRSPGGWIAGDPRSSSSLFLDLNHYHQHRHSPLFVMASAPLSSRHVGLRCGRRLSSPARAPLARFSPNPHSLPARHVRLRTAPVANSPAGRHVAIAAPLDLQQSAIVLSKVLSNPDLTIWTRLFANFFTFLSFCEASIDRILV
jgi:hypothetical protein